MATSSCQGSPWECETIRHNFTGTWVIFAPPTISTKTFSPYPNIVTSTWQSLNTRDLSGVISLRNKSSPSAILQYFLPSETTNWCRRRLGPTTFSNLRIGSTLQFFAPSGSRTNRHDHQLHTYYHWIQGGVDFVSLDNASKDQFDDEQLAWIERTLTLDETNADVRSVVFGMHGALPDSIPAGHSMNESAQMERSGRRVYQDLLTFRSKTKKNVYVLASHDHFLIEDAYHDSCHSAPNSVLSGWIVGTAGAERYRLPSDVAGAKQARTDVYGYLLATVQADGAIAFQFKEVKPDGIPSQVRDRYGSKQVQGCFEENKSPYVPAGPDCTGQ